MTKKRLDRRTYREESVIKPRQAVNVPNPRKDWKPTEYELIRQRSVADREGLIARLSKNLRQDGECQIWMGHTDANGYARINFRLSGSGHKRTGTFMKVGVHRLFLTLKLCRPIKPLHEAGHLPECCNPLCVKHVVEQTREENIRQIRRGKKPSKDDCPF